jgi:hypothetical protein
MGAKRQECKECGLVWSTGEMLEPKKGRAKDCPFCRVENAERTAANLGNAMDAAHRRIGVLERQVEGLENRTIDGWLICLLCRKLVAEGPAQVVKGGVVHEKCLGAFQQRKSAEVECSVCRGKGTVPQG